jgi:pimeloyl-ACP methyl ester carboxylesterase
MLALPAGDIALLEAGDGTPLLFLHGGLGVFPDDPAIAALARKRRVMAPSHPGFGASALPDWLDRIEDVAHIHLALLDALGLASVDIVGCSIGGWIAAEMAAMAPERVTRMVLAAPVGIKVGPIDRLDVPDIFAMPEADVRRLYFHAPDAARIDVATLADERLAAMMRNRETLALLTWEPYMHNPKLKYRLHRIRRPVLFLRGASDGFVSDAYLRSYAALLPDSRLDTIAAAGHMVAMEQPEAFAAKALAFLG